MARRGAKRPLGAHQSATRAKRLQRPHCASALRGAGAWGASTPSGEVPGPPADAAPRERSIRVLARRIGGGPRRRQPRRDACAPRPSVQQPWRRANGRSFRPASAFTRRAGGRRKRDRRPQRPSRDSRRRPARALLTSSRSRSPLALLAWRTRRRGRPRRPPSPCLSWAFSLLYDFAVVPWPSRVSRVRCTANSPSLAGFLIALLHWARQRRTRREPREASVSTRAARGRKRSSIVARLPVVMITPLSRHFMI